VALSKKQRVFIEEYLKCWNATEAARRAGYSERYLHTNASKLLQNTTIAEKIQERLNEKAMSADEVLTRLADMARGSIEDFIDLKPGIKSPFLDLSKAQEMGLLHLIKKLKYNAQGKLEIELHDAQAALALLGKHHKLFTEKVEVVGLEDVLRSLPAEFSDAVRQSLAELVRQERS
jgi:phage terminase small subunit